MFQSPLTVFSGGFLSHDHADHSALYTSETTTEKKERKKSVSNVSVSVGSLGFFFLIITHIIRHCIHWIWSETTMARINNKKTTTRNQSGLMLKMKLFNIDMHVKGLMPGDAAVVQHE